LRAVPASEETAAAARAAGIPLVGLGEVSGLDLVIDGADEVDVAGRMIKGAGGALLREKVLASIARTLVIAIDPSKLVERLGARPLPVEVVPFARPVVERRLGAMGLVPALRLRADRTPYSTDQGNLILDCRVTAIDDPEALARALDQVIGLVEHGLFVGLRPI